MLPTNNYKPRIPKNIKSKPIKAPAFNNWLSEATKVPTKLFILGIAFMLLKGLNALKFLRDFKLILLPNENNLKRSSMSLKRAVIL